MRRLRPALAFCALSIGLLGCAHGMQAGGSDRAVLHQRVLVDAGADSVLIAELLDAHGAPPALLLRRIDRCGERLERRLDDRAAAAAAAEAVRAGLPFEESLPSEIAIGAKPAWQDRIAGSGRLAGFDVEIASASDRYGPHRLLRLVGPDGRAVEITRLAVGAEMQMAPAGETALLLRVDGPGLRRDLRRIDLGAGARKLAVAAGEGQLAAGDPAGALAAAADAARFPPCGSDGAPAWLRTRALAMNGAGADAILAALAEAVGADPGLYRMYARLAPELEGLRGDPRFLELTRPRPLPGGHGAERVR